MRDLLVVESAVPTEGGVTVSPDLDPFQGWRSGTLTAMVVHPDGHSRFAPVDLELTSKKVHDEDPPRTIYCVVATFPTLALDDLPPGTRVWVIDPV